MCEDRMFLLVRFQYHHFWEVWLGNHRILLYWSSQCSIQLVQFIQKSRFCLVQLRYVRQVIPLLHWLVLLCQVSKSLLMVQTHQLELNRSNLCRVPKNRRALWRDVTMPCSGHKGQPHLLLFEMLLYLGKQEGRRGLKLHLSCNHLLNVLLLCSQNYFEAKKPFQ